MTDLEARAIRALRTVKMPAEGWHARRREYLSQRLALQPRARLIETQQGDLWYMVWRYRRQVKDAAVVAESDRIVNGALNLVYEMEPSLAKG